MAQVSAGARHRPPRARVVARPVPSSAALFRRTAGAPLSPRRAVLFASLAPLSWGGAYVVTRELLPAGDPFVLAALRCLPAGLLLLALGRAVLPRGAWWWRAAALGALNVGVCNACVVFSAQRLPSGVASTLAATQPLVVALLAAVAARSAPRRSALGAGAVGVVGVALLTAAAPDRLDPAALAAGLGAVVAMSLGMHLGTRWGRPVPLATFLSWQLLAGAALLLPVAALSGGLRTGLPALDAPTLLGLGYTSVLATGVAYLAWFTAVERTSASAAAFLGLLTPVVAAGAGALLLGEHLTPVQLSGLVLALAALYLGRDPAPEHVAPGDAGHGNAGHGGAGRGTVVPCGSPTSATPA